MPMKPSTVIAIVFLALVLFGCNDDKAKSAHDKAMQDWGRIDPVTVPDPFGLGK